MKSNLKMKIYFFLSNITCGSIKEKFKNKYAKYEARYINSKNSSFYKHSYSQDGEDVLLDAFYESIPDYKGFYVDLGAYHPLKYSNTQRFYEKGWTGINVDATPYSMEAFNRLRPNDINVELGVAAKEGELLYYSFEEPALNSFNKELSEVARNQYKLKEKITVKVKPINDILAKYLPANTQIDFISIDIESLEFEILKSFNFDLYAPQYFLIEQLEIVDKDFASICQTPLYQLMREHHYIPVAKTRRTVLYSRLQ